MAEKCKWKTLAWILYGIICVILSNTMMNHNLPSPPKILRQHRTRLWKHQLFWQHAFEGVLSTSQKTIACTVLSEKMKAGPAIIQKLQLLDLENLQIYPDVFWQKKNQKQNLSNTTYSPTDMSTQYPCPSSAWLLGNARSVANFLFFNFSNKLLQMLLRVTQLPYVFFVCTTWFEWAVTRNCYELTISMGFGKKIFFQLQSAWWIFFFFLTTELLVYNNSVLEVC